jgi:hypothetical protein
MGIGCREAAAGGGCGCCAQRRQKEPSSRNPHDLPVAYLKSP